MKGGTRLQDLCTLAERMTAFHSSKEVEQAVKGVRNIESRKMELLHIPAHRRIRGCHEQTDKNSHMDKYLIGF